MQLLIEKHHRPKLSSNLLKTEYDGGTYCALQFIENVKHWSIEQLRSFFLCFGIDPCIVNVLKNAPINQDMSKMDYCKPDQYRCDLVKMQTEQQLLLNSWSTRYQELNIKIKQVESEPESKLQQFKLHQLKAEKEQAEKVKPSTPISTTEIDYFNFLFNYILKQYND